MEEKQHIYIYSDRKKRQQMNIGTLVLLLNQTQHQKKTKQFTNMYQHHARVCVHQMIQSNEL